LSVLGIVKTRFDLRVSTHEVHLVVSRILDFCYFAARLENRESTKVAHIDAHE